MFRFIKNLFCYWRECKHCNNGYADIECHGYDIYGEPILEPIRCEHCDGFGWDTKWWFNLYRKYQHYKQYFNGKLPLKNLIRRN